MAKSYERGYGRSLRMHDRLIEGVMRSQWRPGEAAVYDSLKPSWTPERWPTRANQAPAQSVDQKPTSESLEALKAKWS